MLDLCACILLASPLPHPSFPSRASSTPTASVDKEDQAEEIIEVPCGHAKTWHGDHTVGEEVSVYFVLPTLGTNRGKEGRYCPGAFYS